MLVTTLSVRLNYLVSFCEVEAFLSKYFHFKMHIAQLNDILSIYWGGIVAFYNISFNWHNTDKSPNLTNGFSKCIFLWEHLKIKSINFCGLWPLFDNSLSFLGAYKVLQSNISLSFQFFNSLLIINSYCWNSHCFLLAAQAMVRISNQF